MSIRNSFMSLLLQYQIMKESKTQRSKRGSMVVNLVQTPAGYSVIEGTQLLNKLHHHTNPSTHSHSHLASSIQIGALPSQKQPKLSIKQTNLLFLRGVFGDSTLGYEKSPSPQPPLPSKTNFQFAQWFNPSKVSKVEIDELKEWFLEDHPRLSPDELQELHEFDQLLQKYLHNRNKIIQIYHQDFLPSNKYMSTKAITKFLCEDVCWLMRIHTFLNSWGLINSNSLNLENQNLHTNYIFKFNHTTKKFQLLNNEFKTSKTAGNIPQQEPATTEQQNLVLKGITKQIRPYCDFCGIHCGIVWFQHLRSIDPKEISTIMKNVNSKNPPLSEKQYEIVLCVKCYCDGNFPLLLTHHDFKKVSVNDRLQPGKKKKHKKKRKEKRRKIKEKEQLMEEEEEYRYEEEKLEEGNKEDDDISKENKDKKESNKKIQSNENVEEGNKMEKQESERKVAQMINEVISRIEKERTWTLEQIAYLLELVEKYDDKWDLIHKEMIKRGYCYDCSPEDLINFFLTMPERGLTKMNYEVNNAQFIRQNQQLNKSKHYVKLIERNLNNAIRVLEERKEAMEELQVGGGGKKEWKRGLDGIAKLNMEKLEKRMKGMVELQKKGKEINRTTQMAFP